MNRTQTVSLEKLEPGFVEGSGVFSGFLRENRSQTRDPPRSQPDSTPQFLSLQLHLPLSSPPIGRNPVPRPGELPAADTTTWREACCRRSPDCEPRPSLYEKPELITAPGQRPDSERQRSNVSL
ncbi:Hypothetical predicted protein [Xyrichtys novacula]|uniref:Uncharacterized protein n=1 Tax=Xyrichtys novacula TaxID=13765 RepID=A0AAV1ENB2_XYRNO|nr:Hypothetical predicted protein [Xyrichtys novacula]